jgi:hypothetical protein
MPQTPPLKDLPLTDEQASKSTVSHETLLGSKSKLVAEPVADEDNTARDSSEAQSASSPAIPSPLSEMLTPVPMPPPEHVCIMLELLMDDLNLTEDKKHVLRRLPDSRKWLMLIQHLSDRYRDPGPTDEVKEIERLQENSEDKALLSDLVVSLRSRPIRWISNFIDSDGLKVLLRNLESLEERKKYTHSLSEIFLIRSSF